jgi:hypothetical protein
MSKIALQAKAGDGCDGREMLLDQINGSGLGGGVVDQHDMQFAKRRERAVQVSE